MPQKRCKRGLTRLDEDHITGLVAALERYQVDAVVWREMGCRESVCERWCQLLAEEGAAPYRGEAGLDIAPDECAAYQLLASGSPLASTVPTAPHHGSCTSTTAPFLEDVDPEMVVVSVGENDFGHPRDEVLERLELVLSGVERRPLYGADDSLFPGDDGQVGPVSPLHPRRVRALTLMGLVVVGSDGEVVVLARIETD